MTTITIYSTQYCSACNVLTAWLDGLGQSYTKKVTDTDPAIMAEFMAVNDGDIGVPYSVITTDDGSQTKIPGYDQARFKTVLGIA